MIHASDNPSSDSSSESKPSLPEPGEILVLKFGGSILHSPDACRAVVQEVYREVRKGRRVVCVCSAFHGETNRLIAHARGFSSDPEKRSYAAYVATGETASSAHVAMALDEAGIPASFMDPAQIELMTEGCHLDAEPVSVNTDVIRRELADGRVVVVPGFAGRDERGYTTLLGRGGSDYTALFIAHELGADCRLIKDVDGWFDRDPKHAKAKRYARLASADAVESHAPVVQHKCVEYAAEHRFFFEVAAMGSEGGTLVGPEPSMFAPEPPLGSEAPVRVVLLGLGTVGGGVLKHLRAEPDRFRIEKILVRDPSKHAGAVDDASLLTSDADEAFAVECDVVVELIGGVDRAGELVQRALEAGRHVVTANKALLAARGVELERIARASGAKLLGSASVGGAVPMLELAALLHDAKADVVELAGVVNGTCNFILDEMAAGASYADALAEAQRLGFAEADPSADVGGHDAAAKICLLTRTLYDPGFDADAVETSGIDHLATQRAPAGARLVARVCRAGDGFEASVGLEAIAPGNALGSVRAEENVLVATFADGAVRLVRGKGAGRWPTAAAVFADIRDAACIVRQSGSAADTGERFAHE